VKEARRKDVTWLARTDPARKEIEFSHHWDALDPDGKRYIALHEQAHLETGPDHNDRFYSVLKRLVAEHRIPWKVAYELEAYNCHAKH
jgi:predicted metal-dependent hydrolase